jgi:signal transduction histidine kinase
MGHTSLALLVSVFILFRACREGHEDGVFAFSSWMLLFAIAMIDFILLVVFSVHMTQLAPLASALFVLLQSQIAAHRTVRAHNLATRMQKAEQIAQRTVWLEVQARFHLASAVAHRLNNPLNYIQLSLHEIRRLSEKQRRALRQLHEACDPGDRETRAFLSDLDNLFENMDLPFSDAKQGLRTAAESVQEIRALSGVDGELYEELSIASITQEALDRLRQEMGVEISNRLSFSVCLEASQRFLGNRFLLKNAVELFVKSVLVNSQGPLVLKINNEHNSLNFDLEGQMDENAIGVMELQEQLAHLMRDFRARISLSSTSQGLRLCCEWPERMDLVRGLAG